MPRLFILCALFFFSCSKRDKAIDRKSDEFTFPAIIHQIKFDSLGQWETDKINEVIPKFIGHYAFADTVNFDNKRQNKIISKEQLEWMVKVYDFDTLSSDGLQIYPDYEKTILSTYLPEESIGYPYFPVYVVNLTSEPKLFFAKGSNVFAIQEAVDTSDYNSWYAIEAEAPNMCGNGEFRLKLLPNEFIVFLMPKYSGSDTTYLRTRIKNGESIIISKPYLGTIDKRQFNMSQDNYWMKGWGGVMFYWARIKE